MPEPSSGTTLDDRIRALELEVTDLRRERRRRALAPARPSRARRILVSISVIMAVGLLPMVAVASDTFTDVSDTNQFHDAINNLYNGGLTRGCTSTPPLQYCPTNGVNRQQMAGFLNRGLGRAALGTGAVSAAADESALVIASASLDPGGLTGGTGFVVVTGSVTAGTTSGTTCPCEIGMRVRNTTASQQPGLWQFFDVSNTASPSGYRNGSGSISWVFEVPSGETQDFDLIANVDMTGATGDVDLQGHITAVYVPFGSTGGSILSTFGLQGVPTNGRGN